MSKEVMLQVNIGVQMPDDYAREDLPVDQTLDGEVEEKGLAWLVNSHNCRLSSVEDVTN